MNSIVRQPDWMNMTLLEGMDRLYPGWRQRRYADLLSNPSTDWLGSLYAQYAGAASPSGMPGVQSMRGYYPYPHRHDCGCDECRHHRHHAWHHYYPGHDDHHHHHHREGYDHHRDCHCHHCRPDHCECVCCIGDVDMVIYARVGEQRVIPLVVENERRREKTITVELGAWHTRGGGAAPVETISFEPKSFTLAPCAEREILIAVRIAAPQRQPTPDNSRGDEAERGSRDVDECLVATADLTLTGCDHRPIRIAIAILPRDCDTFTIGCGCGCC